MYVCVNVYNSKSYLSFTLKVCQALYFDKLALLWGEAQLCLPYVSLKKEKQRKERGYLCSDGLPGVIIIEK